MTPQKVLSPMLLLPLLLLQSPRCCVLGTSEKDIQCLQAFKDSVNDPLGSLESWTMSDLGTYDYCASYVRGVTCLHGVLNEITLPDSSLSGSFPDVRMCSFLNTLDLSHNSFSGPISKTLCTDVPQLVTINLANNQFDGPVPETLATCYFLNDLYLQDNDLCGPLPDNFNNETLPRLKEFVTYGNNLDTSCVLASPAATPMSTVSKKRSSSGMIVGPAIGAFGVTVLAALGLSAYSWSSSRRLRNHGKDPLSLEGRRLDHAYSGTEFHYCWHV